MTLDTRIYAPGADYREVFTKVNQIIGAHEGIRFEDGADSIMNLPGQGLGAWVIVYHRDGEPVEVSIDTVYSYSGPDGGCGDLHARVVAELGQWLDFKGVAWSWQNEFTGEVHQRYDGLTDLAGEGAEASAWVRDIVMPALFGQERDDGV
jgi:hypothetical protein